MSGEHFDVIPCLKAEDSISRRKERELGFAVQWPGIPVASPRFHGASRRDVSGRVYIRVAGKTAGHALVEGLVLATLPCYVPARAAALRRVRRWYLFNPSVCFLLQPSDQNAPARTQNAVVQRGFLRHVPARSFRCSLRRAGHRLKLQVFDADYVETPHSCVVVLDRLLLDGNRPCCKPGVVRPCFGQLSATLGKARHPAAPGPPFTLLLNAKIPHVSSVPAMLHEYGRLFGSRLKTVAVHANIVAETVGLGDQMEAVRWCYMRLRWSR